jgi:hypothetical protein
MSNNPRALLGKLAVLVASAQIIACGGNGDEPRRDFSTVSEPPRAAAAQAVVNRNQALLDSLGVFPGALLVREYVKDSGAVGRDYGTLSSPSQAATDTTLFYRDKLAAQGWETVQEHAAISVYRKGEQTLTIMRYGPSAPAPEAGQKTITTGIYTLQPSFYFGIEAG